MRVQDREEIYQLYDQFINTCIIGSDSLLTDHRGILTSQKLEDVIRRFVDGFDESKRSFEEKVQDQFNGAEDSIRLVFAHFNWLWSLADNDISYQTRIDSLKAIWGNGNPFTFNPLVFPPKGLGSAGIYYKTNKYHEIRFLLLLVKELKAEIDAVGALSLDQVKERIEQMMLMQKYGTGQGAETTIDPVLSQGAVRTCGMFNVLLHLSNPEQYERIFSDNHKSMLVNTFSGLLPMAEAGSASATPDEKIFRIRQELSRITNDDAFDFYDDAYVDIWRYKPAVEEFTELQALEYKKNIILYGPPGTSKSTNAEKVAKILITTKFLQHNANIETYFVSRTTIFDSHIHRLQLHANYTYDDFIAGVQLTNGTTGPKKGYLLKLIDDIAGDPLPHVLILDEINRVDLSKLFGELFSAIENRGKRIQLQFDELSITIPDNLYFIGTMNEIDFSLERVDFALRRRFSWFFYGFNKETLLTMLREMSKKENIVIPETDLELLALKAEELNQIITRDIDDLGKQYQVGHTFFAEIVPIAKAYIASNGKKKADLYKKGGVYPPVQILWNISILPIIEAFLGNITSEEKEKYISRLGDVFLHA